MHVAIKKTSLGHVLVAATDKGVTAVLLGDNEAALKRDLKKRFPDTTRESGGSKFQKLVAKVMQSIEFPGHPGTRDIPLDLHGTPFQKRVWAALRTIEPGTTASYKAVARKIGRPEAPRAVGTAIGANPVAILVPCHRVIRADGSLSGYHWGVNRKRELLAREQQHQPKAAA